MPNSETASSRATHGGPGKTGPRDSLAIAIVGSGGAGVISAGEMLIRAAYRAGFYALMSRSIGPQIRGGESAAMVRISPEPLNGPGDDFDLLIAIDWANAERFADEIPLREDSLIVHDPNNGTVPTAIAMPGSPRLIELPFKEVLKEVAGGRPNMAAIGLVCAFAGIPIDALMPAVERRFRGKGEAVLAASRDSVQAGAAWGQAHLGRPVLRAATGSGDGRWVISGNKACAVGALRGGVRFVAAYPITPATDMLEWMSPRIGALGGTLLQVEDELAAVNCILGSSFAGIPSLTATSGPGLSLMAEGLGLAVSAEIPLVVVNVARGGPSTGIPTKSEQADLNLAIYGMHGDAPHLVLGPTGIADCLRTTQGAVELAEKLQCPAIVLSDQQLAQSQAVIDGPAEPEPFIAARRSPKGPVLDYARYALSGDWVSPMALPGTPGGAYTAEGLEHNERGVPSSSALDHQLQSEKRLRKLTQFDYGDIWAEIEGEGELAIVTWGSCVGPARDATRRALGKGRKIRLVALRLLFPALSERFAEALSGVRRIVVVEQTHSGQFLHYLRAHYALPEDVRCLKRPGPLPIRPSDVLNFIDEWSET